MLVENFITLYITTKRELNLVQKWGLVGKIGDIIEFPISYLSIASHRLVKARCVKCGTIKEMKYQTYNKVTHNETDDYYCNQKDCIKEKRCLRLQAKYGVDNVFRLETIKDQSKQTCLERYGVENAHQNEEIIQRAETTNIERYGFPNPFQNEECKEKSRATMQERYQVDYPQQSKAIQQKTIASNQKNLGVNWPMQNLSVFAKGQKNSFSIKKFRTTTLYYQGSYELDFLERYYDRVQVERGFSILYGEGLIYHPDFYLPAYDLVVEIKSQYWYERHRLKCEAKREQVLKHHRYVLIMDKDYTELDTIYFHFFNI